MNTPKGIYVNGNIIFENLIEYEEYYLIKENNAYKFIIGKEENELIIKCKNYEIKLNNNDLRILTKALLNSIDDSYKFIINIFEDNKVKIKDIIINKTIKLLLKIYIYNKEKEIEMILIYNKENKDLIINELNNKNNNLKKEINILKNEVNFLKQEINELNISKNNSNCKDIQNFDEEEFKSNPKQIEYSKDLVIDSYAYNCIDNTYITFKLSNKIIYLIYSNKNNSIISYDITNNQKIKEIKNAHNNYIRNFRYYFDKINNENLILSISIDNDIKLWNLKNWENFLNLKNINNEGNIYSACFLNSNNNNYILTSNSNKNGICESIKVLDFKGNKIKEINDSNENTVFIDSYYDNKLYKTYIITGNEGYIKSYDYTENKLYHKYNDNNDNKEDHDSIIINDKEKIIKIIESCEDGNIRIWNFHSGDLLNKIKIINCILYGICLWNNEYLFAGCDDKNIKLIDLKKGVIIKDLIGHNWEVLTIKKIIYPKYVECLISQNSEISEIKIWINKLSLFYKLF